MSEKAAGIKHDKEKPDMSLLSSIALFKIAEVMTYGKGKYGAQNWRGGLAWCRILSAIFRHLFAFLGGENLDPESGLHHVAHAGAGILMLLEMIFTRPELDDRYKDENAHNPK